MLEDVDGIEFVELRGEDVVRHRIVAAIVEAYERFERERDRDAKRGRRT